jgi:hypothetical protein
MFFLIAGEQENTVINELETGIHYIKNFDLF